MMLHTCCRIAPRMVLLLLRLICNRRRHGRPDAVIIVFSVDDVHNNKVKGRSS
jgi:hypothetical protein